MSHSPEHNDSTWRVSGSPYWPIVWTSALHPKSSSHHFSIISIKDPLTVGRDSGNITSSCHRASGGWVVPQSKLLQRKLSSRFVLDSWTYKRAFWIYRYSTLKSSERDGRGGVRMGKRKGHGKTGGEEKKRQSFPKIHFNITFLQKLKW